MASSSTQTIHLVRSEPCSNCGHTQIVHADCDNAITSGTAAHVNLVGKGDSNRASKQLFTNTPGFAIYMANLLLIGGAVAISILPNSASSPLIFGGFLIGHLCLSAHSIRLNERGLLFLNATLATLDLYALFIRF